MSQSTQHTFQAFYPSEPKPRSIVPLESPTFDIELKDLQGDIFPTFPKKAEDFLFFKINDANGFRSKLSQLIPHITTSAQVIEKLREIKEYRINRLRSAEPGPRQLIRLEQTSISFSSKGLAILDRTARVIAEGQGRDVEFETGQRALAVDDLGDKPIPNTKEPSEWEETFNQEIHGVIFVASERPATAHSSIASVIKLFGSTMHVIDIVEGQSRPGCEEGHEHFGFLDGVSEPALRGLTLPHKGQLRCDSGVIIMGYRGDPFLGKRPTWTKNGSMMVFRKLFQRVPEFNKFLEDNPVNDSPDKSLTKKEKIALRGARLVGRWKSGAPLDLAPTRDKPELALDVDKVNNFDYTKLEPSETDTGVPGQFRCPFAAHIRKTAPREGTDQDVEGGSVDLERTLIVRAGIPYGEEVTEDEHANNETDKDRGLCFVAYQSSIRNGFRLMQRFWANNPTFPPQAAFDPADGSVVGFDPIIGNNQGKPRDVFGTDAKDFTKKLEFGENDNFVVARGGEYFFVPSISTLWKIANGEVLGAALPSDQQGA